MRSTRLVATLAWIVPGAMAQASFSLNDFISIAQSLGSELGPEPTPSSRLTRSSTLSTSTSQTSLRSSTHSTPASTQTPSVTSTPSQTAAPTSNSGLSPHTRTIIIAVTVVLGLLLLAILIGLFLCLRRRRRDRAEVHHAPIEPRSDRYRFLVLPWNRGNRGNRTHNQPESTRSRYGRFGLFALPWLRRHREKQQMSEIPQENPRLNDDWEKGGNRHHGFVPAAAASAGAFSHHSNHSTASQRQLMQNRLAEDGHRPPIARPPTNEHPAFKNQEAAVDANTNKSTTNNPFAPDPPPVRKPIPTNRNNHHDGILGAGLAALAGAAALRHEKKKRAQAGNNSHLGLGIENNENNNATSYDPGRHHIDDPSATGAFGAAAVPRHGGQQHEADSSAAGRRSLGVPALGDEKRRSYEPGFDDSRYSYDSYKRDSDAPLAAGAAAVAGAGAGALAEHEHGKHTHGQLAEGGDESERSSYDPNRPPTPFGLGAFGGSPKTGAPEARPGPFPRHGSIEPTVAAMHHSTAEDPFAATQRSGSFPDPTVAENSQSYPYHHTADPPTNAQRRSLQDREMLLAGPGREVQHSPPYGADIGSTHASYGEVASTRSSDNSSGLRVPSAAIGAVGRDNPRVVASEDASPAGRKSLSHEEDEVTDEHTPLSGPSTQAASVAPVRPSALRNQAVASEQDPSHLGRAESYSSESGGSWRSASDGPAPRPAMLARDSNSFGLPSPAQPWAGGMPGAFPGERPAVPAYTLGARHRGSGGYSPVRQSDEYPGGLRHSPALRPSQGRSSNGSSSDEYDPYSYERPSAIGSGRRSFGSAGTGGSPGRSKAGVVRFSNRNDEWRYDDGDDYSERGGGGGNVYDGYKYDGGSPVGRNESEEDNGHVGRAL